MLRRILAVVLVLAMCVSFSGLALAGEMKTITGTLVSGDQLMADDGQEYMIDEASAAKDLDQMVDKKVEVKGTVMEKDGKQVLQIESIKPVE